MKRAFGFLVALSIAGLFVGEASACHRGRRQSCCCAQASCCYAPVSRCCAPVSCCAPVVLRTLGAAPDGEFWNARLPSRRPARQAADFLAGSSPNPASAKPPASLPK